MQWLLAGCQDVSRCFKCIIQTQGKLLSLLSVNLHDKVVLGLQMLRVVMSHEDNHVCLRTMFVDKMSAVVMGK